MSSNADAAPVPGAGGEAAAAPQVVPEAPAKSSRDSLLMKLSVLVMVIGIVVSVVGYFMSHGTNSTLTQNDALTISIIGISVTVAGGALFVRYSFSAFMRFWLARLTFEMRGDGPSH
jgi:hypothetical protein